MSQQSKLHLKSQPTLADYQQYMAQMVKERGFKDDAPRKFMMLIEEVGEFAKASRKHAGMKLAGNATKQNVADEAADVFIVLLGLCNILGIDLEQAFRHKEEKNKQRTWK